MDQRTHYQNRGAGRFGRGRGFPGRQNYRGGDGFRGGRGYGNRGARGQGNPEYRERRNPMDQERHEGIQRDPKGDHQIENNTESVEKEQSGNNIMEHVANSDQEKPTEIREDVRENRGNQNYDTHGICIRCGKPRHLPEACHNPIKCERGDKEGHVARVCSEKMPWDFISPFFGFSAYGQGFHFIKSSSNDEGIKDMSNIALITITEGVASTKQVENEFKLKAGPASTWRWYAKKVDDNKFQMRFPNSKTIEDIAYFTEMRMGSLTSVVFKVEKWNSASGSKGPLDTAWFRIKGIPYEKRSFPNMCMVASEVGVPLEVDKANLTKWEYVRVKIGCRDVTKVPAKVDGVLDFYLHDFRFQREVEQAGYTNPAGNKWIRNGTDKSAYDNPSPKKTRFEGSFQANNSEAGPSNYVGTNKQVAGGGCKDNMDNELYDNEESEDEGLEMDDLCKPGAERLTFGDFSEVEIRKLTCMQFIEGGSTIINQYGTNMCGYKFDLLAAIEANRALLSSGKVSEDKICQTGTDSGQSSKMKELAEVEEEVLGTAIDRAVSLSPHQSTQDPPAVVSSQEEGLEKMQVEDVLDDEKLQVEDVLDDNTTSLDIQKKDEVTYEVELSQEDGSQKVVLEEVMHIKGSSQGDDMGSVEVETTDNMDNSVGILSLGNNKENGDEWQEVRQSKRIKDNGTAQLRIDEQLKIKMAKDQISQGMQTPELEQQVI